MPLWLLVLSTTGKDRTNWNGEITSQQTLRSDPGTAALIQTRAVVSPGCGAREAKAKICSASLSADLPTHAREGFSHLHITTSSLVSHRAGREDAEKGGLENESAPGEMFSMAAFLCGSLEICQSRC